MTNKGLWGAAPLAAGLLSCGGGKSNGPSPNYFPTATGTSWTYAVTQFGMTYSPARRMRRRIVKMRQFA
jgi:hypothetical protein